MREEGKVDRNGGREGQGQEESLSLGRAEGGKEREGEGGKEGKGKKEERKERGEKGRMGGDMSKQWQGELCKREECK